MVAGSGVRRLIVFLAALISLLQVLMIGMLAFWSASVASADDRQSSADNTPISLFFRGVENGYDPNQSIERHAAALTGVHLRPLAEAGADTGYDDVLRPDVEYGAIPDLLAGPGIRSAANTLGPEGALLNLDAHITDTAPNIEAFFQAYPALKSAASAPDGKLYHIPAFDPVPNGAVWVIRQDWLQRLELEVPQTVTALRGVLDAFLTGDPNGNGLADEIPLYVGGTTAVDALLALWGVHAGGAGEWRGFFESGNGVNFAFASEAYRDAMIHLSDWVSAGLMNPDAFVASGSEVDDDAENTRWIDNDLAGVSLIRPEILDDVVARSGIELIPMAPPASAAGTRLAGRQDPILRDAGWAISHGAHDPAALLRYIDFWFSDEGIRLANFGIEGEHHDTVNGRTVFRRAVGESMAELHSRLEREGVRIPRGYLGDPDYWTAALGSLGREARALYLSGEFWQPSFMTPALTRSERAILNDALPTIHHYLREKTFAWISGEGNAQADWGNYLATLEELGLDMVLNLTDKAKRRLGCACGQTLSAIPMPPEDIDDPTISDPPITLTVHFRAHFLSNGYDADSLVEQVASERTGVALSNFPINDVESTGEAIRWMIEEQNSPDILGGNYIAEDVNYWGVQGAFLPLDTLIDTHAPHLRHFLATHAELVNSVRATDGHLYYIPLFPDGVYSVGYFIRHDWLEVLNLDVPQTVDEYYRVLKAFRERDPNGNGVRDEIPYFSRGLGNLFHLVTLWDARSSGSEEVFDFYIKDGLIRHGAVEAPYRTAIRQLSKWYQEGLIDTDLMQNGTSDRDRLLRKNLGGATRDWFGSTAGYNTLLHDSIEGFSLRPIAPPLTPSGHRIEERRRERILPYGWAITHTNAHPVETIRYFDYWFSPEGRRLANFGVEGIHYDLIDGKPVFRDEVLNGSRSVIEQLHEAGAQLPRGFHQDFSYEKQWMNRIALEGIQMYEKGDFLLEKLPTFNLNEDQQRIYDRYWNPLRTYMQAQAIRWISGEGNVDAEWDNYLREVRSRGLDLLMSVLNEASRSNNCRCLSGTTR